MKKFAIFATTCLLALAGAGNVAAQSAPSGDEEMERGIQAPPSVRAIIRAEVDGSVQTLLGIFLFKVEDGEIIYADNPESFNAERLPVAAIQNVAVELPEVIENALSAYRARQFDDALPLLNRVVRRYEPLRDLDFLPIRQAEIYRFDCMRRMGEFDQLRDELAVLEREEFTSSEQAVLSVFPAWEAHAAEDWPRVRVITRDPDSVPPGPAAAEMAFLRGEALRHLAEREGSERAEMLNDALAEYHRAMTMDYTFSRDLVGDAAIAALRIYDADERVAEYFRRWGTPDFSETAGYVIPVREAAWLAYMIETMDLDGRELPEDLQRFSGLFARFADDLEEAARGEQEDEATAAQAPELAGAEDDIEDLNAGDEGGGDDEPEDE